MYDFDYDEVKTIETFTYERDGIIITEQWLYDKDGKLIDIIYDDEISPDVV